MVDTDYDSLPSPPAPRQRKALNARSGSAKRLYGKRAAKAQAEATAAAAAAAAAVDPGPTTAALGRRGAFAPARADKRRRHHSENEDGELSTPSPDGKPVRRTRSGGAKAKRPAQDESDADVESEGDEQAQAIPATSKPPQRSRAKRQKSQSSETSNELGRKPKASSHPKRISASSEGDHGTKGAMKLDHPEVAGGSSSAQGSASQPFKRGSTAFVDKSNLPSRTPRSRVPQAAQVAAVPTGFRFPASRSVAPVPATARLQVFQDATAAQNVSGPSAPQPSVAPPPISLSFSGSPNRRRTRPPRRLLARHASEPPALADAASIVPVSELPRSPSARRGSTGAWPAGSAHLVPPATQALDTESPSRPAPWALSTPASPLLHQSSSPPNVAATAASAGLPVFRFTTTEFGDSPSLQLDALAAGRMRDFRFAGALGPDLAEGMDSTIMLETWDESLSPLRSSRDHVEEDARIRPTAQDPNTEMEIDQKDRQGDDYWGDQEEDGDATIRASGSGHQQEGPQELTIAGEGVEGKTTYLAEGEHGTAPQDADLVDADSGGEAHDAAHLSTKEADAVLPIQGDDAASGPTAQDGQEEAAQPESTQPVHYTASFMPPRHPRWPIDEPLADGPPSSEDELAYYLRTTGTFSSEHDLPLSGEGPSDESAHEDWLAEREVGRAIKPSSRQREKRLATYDAARGLAQLRLGEGSGGRRQQLQREILPLDEVRLPRRMRASIEAKALQLGEELRRSDSTGGKEEAPAAGGGEPD